MRRPRQSVSVIVALVGIQDTSVAVHRPRTDGAAVSVRVGGALIYMHDAGTVAAFAQAWNRMGRDALRLPRQAGPALVAPVRGMREPAVLIDAADSPPAHGHLERPVGAPSYLRLTIGRVMFDVRDLGAFSSTILAFREAVELVGATFLHVPAAMSPRDRAAQSAARLFPSQRTGTHPAPTARREAAARPAPPARIERPDLLQREC